MSKIRRGGANKQRDLLKEARWRETLGRQAPSGLTVRAFCQREGLTESSFHAWRRTIGQRDQEEQPQEEPVSREPAFVPVVVTNDVSKYDSIHVELSDGLILKLPVSIAAEWLVELVAKLQAKSAEATR